MTTPATQTAAPMADMQQIGQVAERVGLSLRTVRYYEEMGLVIPEKRTDGGFRLYTEANIERLLMIKQMKPLGFSVQETRELLELRDALGSLDRDDPKRLSAAEKLSQFAKAAEKRCQKMRKHLAAGEELAKQLSRESRLLIMVPFGRTPAHGAFIALFIFVMYIALGFATDQGDLQFPAAEKSLEHRAS